MADPRPDTVEGDPATVQTAPSDLLLAAALEELRRRNDELEIASAAREAELEAAVVQRTNELEAAYASAAREHDRLRDLIERLQEGIVAINEGLEVEFANAAAGQLLGRAPLEPGTPLRDPWPEFSLRSLAARLFEPGAEPEEVRIATRDRTIRVAGLPAGGASAILVIADISERERRERAERDFVVNAAHELRTPLAAIMNAVEVLQTAKDDPDLRERFLGHLAQQSRRLGRLAEALLVLARAQMEVEAPRREVIDARALLERAAADMRPARDVRVEVESPSGLAVFGHVELLEQALANLTANAARHTSEGRISLRSHRTSEGWVALEVADTGSGIRPDDEDRVTDRFYTAGEQSGFGLGLAIATQVAEALSGRLEIESERGRGTTVRIVLPSAELVSGD